MHLTRQREIAVIDGMISNQHKTRRTVLLVRPKAQIDSEMLKAFANAFLSQDTDLTARHNCKSRGGDEQRVSLSSDGSIPRARCQQYHLG